MESTETGGPQAGMVLVRKGPCTASAFAHPDAPPCTVSTGFLRCACKCCIDEAAKKRERMNGGRVKKTRDQRCGGVLAPVILWGLAECGKPHKILLHGPGILTRQLESFFFPFGCHIYDALVGEAQF